MLRRLIGTAVSLILLVLGLSAFTLKEEDSSARGKDLFRDYCAMCHRLDATGMCMAPSLIGVTNRMSTKEIAAHSRKIAEEMMCARPIKKLSDRDFEEIVEYLKTLDSRRNEENSSTIR